MSLTGLVKCKAWFPYSRSESLTVGLSRSLEYLGCWKSLPTSRWRYFSVVDSPSWPLVVFQSLHLNCYFWRQTYSLPVVDGLSGSLAVAKVILFCFHYGKNETTGSLAVFHGR